MTEFDEEGAEVLDPEPARHLDGSEAGDFTPRDFVVLSRENEVEFEYHIGRLMLASVGGATTGVIAIAEVEGKLLVAFPEPVWHRTVSKRLLPAKALSKALLCEVASCTLHQRRECSDAAPPCKVWVGFLSAEVERQADFLSEEFLTFDFSPHEGLTLLPFASALVDVANANFSFLTADEGIAVDVVPECPPAFPGTQEGRIQALEDSLGAIQKDLKTVLGSIGQLATTPKARARAASQPLAPQASPTSRTKTNPTRKGAPPEISATKASKKNQEEFPGLDMETVQAARAVGVPDHHLKELASVLKNRPRRLEELPRPAPVTSAMGPLAESEDELFPEPTDDEFIPAESGMEKGKTENELSKAIVHLTQIAARLAPPADKQGKIEQLLDGGSGGASSSDGTTVGSSQKMAVAMRALQKTLAEDLRYLYETMEANILSDFQSRPVGPGEPMGSCSIRGWLAARSRIQLYHNHVRWSWQVAGIWDCLIAGKTSEARARCGLLLGAADQASIDGGSWVMSNVALLEQPPPYQSFAHHTQPTAIEMQHSAIFDHRWAQIFLGYLKQVDSFVDAKKKLSSSSKQNQKETQEDQTGRPRAKAKPKAADKKKAAPAPEGAPSGN